MKKIIVRRTACQQLSLNNTPALLQHIYSTRGIQTAADLERSLEHLAPYHLLSNITTAVNYLMTALTLRQHIMIIGDFDADGATSTALAVSCLRKMGAAHVSYLVPNRFEYGYGLTPEIVAVAANRSPQLIMTVDNGISSHAGVLSAQERGIKVIITDHHLPASTLPSAEAIVNPNLPNDQFPSKNLAGVGVVFYVMLALRAKLREQNWFEQQNLMDTNMATFLDWVALGTVADVVPLDKNNRILVHQGLARIRAGKVCQGIKALLTVAGKQLKQLSAKDLGFAIAPRLNAAGRLVDMSLGIECLLTADDMLATQYAKQLDTLNKERRQIEETMRDQAIGQLASLQLEQNLPTGVCLFDEKWHQGIIGILASRVKDLLHRPTFAFALHTEQELKGSGRSIAGLHLKDLLETIAREHPNLIIKFGGHAMAAGVSVLRKNFQRFTEVFNKTVAAILPHDKLQGIIYSDGELTADSINLATANLLQQAGPWGQGFPEPLFDGQFTILNHKILQGKHVKFLLGNNQQSFTVEAMAFNIEAKQLIFNANATIHIVYRLDINEYRGNQSLQLLIEHFELL